MRRHPVAMHQHNGNGADTIVKRRLQPGRQIIEIKRQQNIIIGIDPLSDLFNLLIQHFGQNDMLVKQPWPRLIRDTQLITKPTGDNKQGAVACALQQCVGGNCGAHFDRIDLLGWQGRVSRQPQNVTNPLQGGIIIGLWIFRQ